MAGRATRVARHARAGKPRDAGASSIELVLLAPIVILCILLIGQFAMWYQARHVAIAAAQEGAREARDMAQGIPWQGPAITVGMNYAQQIGGSLLKSVSATAVGNGNQRGITVSGTAPSIIPFPWTFRISETSEGPAECFRPSGDTQQCAGG